MGVGATQQQTSHLRLRCREGNMGTDDKIDAKADQLKGKVKEGVGNATDDPGLQTEGQADQTKGHLKEGVEKVKDAFKKD